MILFQVFAKIRQLDLLILHEIELVEQSSQVAGRNAFKHNPALLLEPIERKWAVFFPSAVDLKILLYGDSLWLSDNANYFFFCIFVLIKNIYIVSLDF